MKYLLNFILIILVFLTGCSNKDGIAKFESILGEEKSETLSGLMYVFENEFLKSNYPELDTEEAYSAFIFDVVRSDLNEWKKIDTLRSKFKENSLNYDVYQIPDSVWIERDKELTEFGTQDRFVVNYKYIDSTGKFNRELSFIPIFDSNLTEESILNRPEHFSLINLEGNYFKALEAVSHSSEFLGVYVDRRKAAGKFLPIVLVNLISEYDVDLTDYFIKRIIVVDMIF